MKKLFPLWMFLLISVKSSSGLPAASNLDYSQCEATEMLPVTPFVSALEKIEVFANISKLGVAIVRNRTQEIEALLSGICDPNDNKTLYSPSCCGWGGTPLTAGLSGLHIAVMTGNLFALEKLLEAENIAVDSPDENGETALFYAVRFGTENQNKQVFEPHWHPLGPFGANLPSIGADLGRVGADFLNPEVIEFPEVQEDQDILESRLKMLNILVDDGANLDAVNKDGETPLMQAVAIGQEEVVQFLIKKGAESKGFDIDTDYSGHGVDGYGWKQIFEVDKCCEECSQEAECTHWTMVRRGGEGHGCWLKTEQGEKSKKIGAISGSQDNCFN